MNKVLAEIILNLLMVILVFIGGWWQYIAAIPVWISFIGICLVAISVKNKNVTSKIYGLWGKKGLSKLIVLMCISVIIGYVFMIKGMFLTGVAHVLSGIMIVMLYVSHFNKHDDRI